MPELAEALMLQYPPQWSHLKPPYNQLTPEPQYLIDVLHNMGVWSRHIIREWSVCPGPGYEDLVIDDPRGTIQRIWNWMLSTQGIAYVPGHAVAYSCGRVHDPAGRGIDVSCITDLVVIPL